MIRVGDFIFTNLSASGYVWSNLTPFLEPAPSPVLIHNITLLSLPDKKFLLDCKSVQVEVAPATFQKQKPIQVRGDYYCDRNENGRIECIHLSLENMVVSIRKGECKALPIPNGEIFLFLPDLSKPTHTAVQAAKELTTVEPESPPEFYTDHDWTEELHFHALFPSLA